MTGAPLDGTTMEALASSLGGDEEGWAFVRELAGTFLEDGPAQLTALRRAIEQGGADEARRAAHTLKSNGATLGAPSFAQLCRELEAIAAAGELQRAPEVLARTETEWLRVRTALEAVARGASP